MKLITLLEYIIWMVHIHPFRDILDEAINAM